VSFVEQLIKLHLHHDEELAAQKRRIKAAMQR
jgi:hypothetical protein